MDKLKSGKHCFIQGPKGIGKSTLIRLCIAHYGDGVGGFFTRRMLRGDGQGHEVRLFRLNPVTGAVDSESVFLFNCPDSPDGREDAGQIRERFNRLAPEILTMAGDCELLIMDELGPHEGEALAFQAAVFELLDGTVPILGVLQDSASEFLAAIAGREDVRMIRFEVENRDALQRDFPEDFFLKHRDSYGLICRSRDQILLKRTGRRWSFPKGHREAYETAECTAIRECLEETGQRARILGPVIGSVPSILPGSYRSVHFFPADICERQAFTPNSEVDEIAWLSPEEALRRLQAAEMPEAETLAVFVDQYMKMADA
ncbi:MAG: nucleoside-triphosphatase [Eubacteriales bacterium]|nr:nucleoside-triphosphatase [Eubacteriales bacterium]